MQLGRSKQNRGLGGMKSHHHPKNRHPSLHHEGQQHKKDSSSQNIKTEVEPTKEDQIQIGTEAILPEVKVATGLERFMRRLEKTVSREHGH